jgi:hypothetical protein
LKRDLNKLSSISAHQAHMAGVAFTLGLVPYFVAEKFTNSNLGRAARVRRWHYPSGGLA